MSKKVYRVDGTQGQNAPLWLPEKKVQPGSGKSAFRNLTAAVRAAEAARDEVRKERNAGHEELARVRALILEVQVEHSKVLRELQEARKECRFWGVLVPSVLILVFVLRLAGWWPQV